MLQELKDVINKDYNCLSKNRKEKLLNDLLGLTQKVNIESNGGFIIQAELENILSEYK